MEKQIFQLQELSVQKMPGLPKGLPAFRALKPHINIVFGRNGSGKSSTARAIQGLIWSNGPTGIQAETSVALGTDHWDLKLEGGKGLVQRNGINETLPGLPAVETSNRYLLALHELVTNDDGALAGEIVKESVGGYDLDNAGRMLGYAYGANTRSAREYKDWENTGWEYDRIKKEQEALKSDECRLASLNKALEEGAEARELIGWYEKLAGWLETKAKLERASNELTTYPVVLGTVTGEEYTTIVALEKERDTVGTVIANAGQEISKNVALMDGLGLPVDGLGATVISELEQRIVLLENGERDLREKSTELEAAMTKERDALARIGVGNAPVDWAGIGPGDIDILDEHLQQQHLTLSERQALEALIQTLTKETTDQPDSTTDELSTGILMLSNWLQEPQGIAGPEWPIWVLIGLGYLTAILTRIYAPIGILSVLLLIAAIWLARKKKTGKANQRELEYRKLGFPQPTAWDRNAVMSTMEELVRQWKTSVWQGKIKVQLEVYGNALKSLGPRLEELSQERARLEARLKVLPDVPDEGQLQRFDALYWFLKRVDEWIQAQDNRKGFAVEKEQLIAECKKQLEEINRLFTEAKLDVAVDGPTARALSSRLKDADKAWRSAQTALAYTREKIEAGSEQRKTLEEKSQSIYIKLDIPEGDKEAIRGLVVRLPAYQKSKQEKDAITRMLQEKRGELETHSRYTVRSGELETVHPDEIQRTLAELAGKVDRLEVHKKELYEIGAKIDDRKKGNSLEQALLKKEEAIEGLAALYETNLAKITGKLILENLKKQTGDENQPAVFRRAKALLSRITSGRYELIVPTAGSGLLFHAYDTVLRLGQPLSELSTGTRVQLLLAVRLAFIEEQERGLALPILADELLATTDEERGKAIIEALMEISREGRQVFYFTAQKEEVYKWMECLEDHPEVSLGIWELDGGSNEVQQLSVQAPEAAGFAFRSDIPDPMGRSHAEYGRDLRIERFDLQGEGVAELHLWYLIDDPNSLAALLRLGISRWGQLITFVTYGGKLPADVEPLMAGARMRVGLLERYQELYQQGRPWPIDRQVLDDSEAISNRYIDEVSERLKELRGNSRELLQLLRNKGVSGFRVSNADDLERYLLEEGYLDDQEPIEHGEILLRLQAFLSQSELGPEAAQQFMERIVALPVEGGSVGGSPEGNLG